MCQLSNLCLKFNYQKSSSAIPLKNVFLVVKSGKVPLRKLKRIWAPNMDIVPVPVRSVFLFPFLIMLLMRSKYCCSSWFFESPFSMVAKSKMIIKRILLGHYHLVTKLLWRVSLLFMFHLLTFELSLVTKSFWKLKGNFPLKNVLFFSLKKCFLNFQNVLCSRYEKYMIWGDIFSHSYYPCFKWVKTKMHLEKECHPIL